MPGKAQYTSVFISALLLLGAGCGDSTDTEPANNGDNNVVNNDVVNNGALSTLSFELMWSQLGEVNVPVSGALVALDTRHGVRVERLSDEAGRVDFEVDPADGPFVATAFKEGHRMTTRTHLGEESTGGEPVRLSLPSGSAYGGERWRDAREEDLTALWFSVEDLESPNHQVLVSSTNASTCFQGHTQEAFLMVERGMPFTLVATLFEFKGSMALGQEFYAWVVIPSEATEEPRAFHLDFDGEYVVQPNRVMGTITFPAWMDDSATIDDQGRGRWSEHVYFSTMARGPYGAAAVGYPSMIDTLEAGDPTRVFTAEWVDPGPGAYELETLYRVVDSHGAISSVLIEGPPLGGDVALPFPAKPISSAEELSRTDALRWDHGEEANNAEGWTILEVSPNSESTATWIVELPPGVTEFTFPEPPSNWMPSRAPREGLAPAPILHLKVQIAFCETRSPELLCRRQAWSSPVKVLWGK